MSLLKRIIFIFFLLSPFSHTFASVVTLVDEFQVSNGFADTTVRAGLATNTDREVGGVQFNDDGTKMFVRFFRDEDGGEGKLDYSFIDEYNLSIPFDASSGTYAGDDERCELDHGESVHNPFDLHFSNDGMFFYIANRKLGGGATAKDLNFVARFDLTAPYDISTCSFSDRTTDLASNDNRNGSAAGASGIAENSGSNKLQGVSLSNDGKKMFVIYSYGHLLEFNLSTAFDVTTFSLVTNAGMDLSSNTNNPQSIEFNDDGTRIFIANHSPNNNPSITQVSLDAPFDTSSFTVDGRVNFNNSTLGTLRQIRTLTFSESGLIMYVGNDDSNSSHPVDKIFEYNLACPFNIISGNCPSITENNVRTGMALAQIEIAKRTIDHSTDTALNRLKWIRRNKDEQNLTNLNIDINFTNQKLASLTEIVRTSAAKKETKDKDEDLFYWSEGSINIGRIGDTSISSARKIGTNAITIGADRFTSNNGIKGLAFRIGRNNVDVGTGGSNLDSDTYNISYYATSPIENDTKFIDSVIGFGKLKSSLLTVIESRDLTANRSGHQMYGTIRIKDEIKKDNLTIIPSGRFDIGHTILGSYEESGSGGGGIDVEKQHIRSKKIRAGLSAVEDISNEKYIIKRHGKLEYVVDVDRSSNFKYTYVEDKSQSFNDILHSEALHNINGEIGIDIVLPDRFSIFLIYERNQAIGSGHTDKIHIAIGYLPNKETNYAFSIDGSDNLKSNYVISKNINDFIIDFKLTNDLLRPEDLDEAFLNLSRKF